MSMHRLTRVAVFNIGWGCLRSDLVNHFKKFGRVYDVRIPMSYNGFNKNMAFITMSLPKDTEQAMLQDYHVIDGSEVSLRIKENNREPRGESHQELS